MQDNNQELLPLVDEEGNVIGSATRGQCHDGSKLLHPVVHLHVFDSQGRLYLQQRPLWKDIQPGKWDTAVGGHVDYGEDITSALQREVREELGITQATMLPLFTYPYRSTTEYELVNAYYTLYDGPITPDIEEVADGKFWSIDDIKNAIGKNILTPNFEMEFEKLLAAIQSDSTPYLSFFL
jgi:isopentenyldiphosphate isomerase